jgi:hypothetical protein
MQIFSYSIHLYRRARRISAVFSSFDEDKMKNWTGKMKSHRVKRAHAKYFIVFGFTVLVFAPLFAVANPKVVAAAAPCGGLRPLSAEVTAPVTQHAPPLVNAPSTTTVKAEVTQANGSPTLPDRVISPLLASTRRLWV